MRRLASAVHTAAAVASFEKGTSGALCAFVVGIVAFAAAGTAASECWTSGEPELAALSRSTRQAHRRSRTGEWLANQRLPYTGDWLDVTAVLGGLTQQDDSGLTIHDDEKCGSAVAVAAAIVAGPKHVEALIDRLDARARGRQREQLRETREHLYDGSLRAKDLNHLSELLYTTYVGGRAGSSDGDVVRMLRASSLARTETGGKTPRQIFEALGPNESFPLNIFLDYPDYQGLHYVLVWRDENGFGRIYDPDRMPGTQLVAETSSRFGPGFLENVARGYRTNWPSGAKFGPAPAAVARGAAP